MTNARNVHRGSRLGRHLASAMLLVLSMSAWLWAQAGPPSGGGVSGRPPSAAPAATTPPAPPVTPAAGQAELDARTGELPTFQKMFMFSPVINSIIAGLSVLALTLFVGNLLTITTGRMLPGAFLSEVTKLVIARRYTEAAEFCRHNRHVFAASIIQRAVENPDADHSTLLEIIETEGRRRADALWNRVSYLIDLSTIAPMLGLLGTVLGMLEAFFVLPKTSASMNSKALAEAIGGAMTATFFGLIVAVLAVVFYAILKSRTLRALSDVEASVHSIADHMKRGGR